MGRRRGSPLYSAEVKEVERQVTHWRRTRRTRSPMPPALWAAAVSLARIHGIYAIARALRVSYETLKRRVEQPSGGGGSLNRREGAGFVEVPAAQLVSSSEAAGTVVELTGSDGARLVVRLRDGDPHLDVLSLADAFWKRRP